MEKIVTVHFYFSLHTFMYFLLYTSLYFTVIKHYLNDRKVSYLFAKENLSPVFVSIIN